MTLTSTVHGDVEIAVVVVTATSVVEVVGASVEVVAGASVDVVAA